MLTEIRLRRGRRSLKRFSRALSALLAAAPFVTFALLQAATARAGSIDPRVWESLAKQPPSAQITVTFSLLPQADIPALDRALKAQHATRQERHRRVVEALQTVARESQGPFLTALDAWSARGEVTGHTPYWISNVVVVRGTRRAIESLASRTDVRAVEPELRAEPSEPFLRRPAESPDSGVRGIGVPPGVRAINAPRVWRELGFNGRRGRGGQPRHRRGWQSPGARTSVAGLQRRPAVAGMLARRSGHAIPLTRTTGTVTERTSMGTMAGLGADHPRHDRRRLGREVDRHERHQPGRGQRLRRRHHHVLPVVLRS